MLRFTVLTFSLASLMACGTAKTEKSDTKIVGGSEFAFDVSKKSPVFPSAIGYKNEAGTRCSAARIADNLYLTASHCFENSIGADILQVKPMKRGDIITVKLSNGAEVRAAVDAVDTLPSSDVAVFQMRFFAKDDKAYMDRMTDIAKMNFSYSHKNGDALTAVGYGCTEEDATTIAHSCKTHATQLKFAKIKVALDTTCGLIAPKSICIAASNKTDNDGYVAAGDSGGPVYNAAGEIVAINRMIAGKADLDVPSLILPIVSPIRLFYDRETGIKIDGLLYTLHARLAHEDAKAFLQKGRSSEALYFNGQLVDFHPFAPIGLIEVDGTSGRKKNTYQGEIYQGEATGKGFLVYHDESSYSGTFLNGKRHGEGVADYSSAAADPKTRYTGEWQDDEITGKGKLELKSGHVYEGYLVKAKMHGEGIMTYPNGDTRNGNFVEGKKDGNFTLTMKKDGSRWAEVYSADSRISITKIP